MGAQVWLLWAVQGEEGSRGWENPPEWPGRVSARGGHSQGAEARTGPTQLVSCLPPTRRPPGVTCKVQASRERTRAPDPQACCRYGGSHERPSLDRSAFGQRPRSWGLFSLQSGRSPGRGGSGAPQNESCLSPKPKPSLFVERLKPLLF